MSWERLRLQGKASDVYDSVRALLWDLNRERKQLCDIGKTPDDVRTLFMQKADALRDQATKEEYARCVELLGEAEKCDLYIGARSFKDTDQCHALNRRDRSIEIFTDSYRSLETEVFDLRYTWCHVEDIFHWRLADWQMVCLLTSKNTGANLQLPTNEEIAAFREKVRANFDRQHAE